MPTPPLSDELAQQAVDAFREHGMKSLAADALGINRRTYDSRLKVAAERGLLGTKAVLPGFRISQVTNTPRGDFVQQRPERGPEWEMPAGHTVRGVSALVDADGRTVQSWIKTNQQAGDQLAAMRAAVDAFKEELPRAETVAAPPSGNREDLLNQFTVTDAHFGSLSWREETGHDYDLAIAERLVTDWFAAAVELSPPASTAVLAQLGDLAHYDGMESKTPTSGHILDGDSRLPKMIRVIIRTMRRVIKMLLAKHDRVHIIMADANHDPAAEAWLREMFASFYEDDPRITVDSSASTYYVYEHGNTSLFFHHGHKRKIGNVDSVFAGQFRDIYGRTKYSYAHLGHLHSDELKSTNLMKVERHETLAAPDAYAANGGWISGRSAKVITYSSEHGEVSRLTLSPQMVNGWSARPQAANDNQPQRSVA